MTLFASEHFRKDSLVTGFPVQFVSLSSLSTFPFSAVSGGGFWRRLPTRACSAHSQRAHR
jgi:hypothetical protein